MLALIGRLLLSRGAFFTYGALASPVISNAAGPVGNVARGAVKSVVKGAYAAGGAVQKAAVNAKQQFEDLAAEAKSELGAQPPAAQHPPAAPAENTPTVA